MQHQSNITARIISFIRSIGIQVRLSPINGETVLPGIQIEHGGLVVDESALLYPGDLLHEAGHLAVAPSVIRMSMNGALDPKKDFELAGELMAIPWSYAAALFIGIEPDIVFHSDGYKGGADSILNNFAAQRYIGLPALEWIGLTTAATFPAMIKWLRD